MQQGQPSKQTKMLVVWFDKFEWHQINYNIK